MPPKGDRLSSKQLRADLVARIKAAADPETKSWSDDYFRHVIKHRGLRAPGLTEVVKEWAHDHKLVPSSAGKHQTGQRTHKRLLLLLWPLVRSRFSEDKLASVIFIERFLLKTAPPHLLVGFFESAYQKGHVYDWGTSDSLCMRVLAPLIEKRAEGVAERVEGWHTSSDMWQRRASIAGFIRAGRGGAYHDVIAKQIERLVPEDERFIQTAIGTVIAQVGRKHPAVAARWVDEHFEELSREVIDRHTKYLPKHASYKAMKRMK